MWLEWHFRKWEKKTIFFDHVLLTKLDIFSNWIIELSCKSEMSSSRWINNSRSIMSITRKAHNIISRFLSRVLSAMSKSAVLHCEYDKNLHWRIDGKDIHRETFFSLWQIIWYHFSMMKLFFRKKNENRTKRR